MPCKCFACSTSLENNKELLRHIRLIHPNSTFYECHSDDKCSGKYRYDTFDSFRKHRSSKHAGEVGTNSYGDTTDLSTDLNSPIIDDDMAPFESRVAVEEKSVDDLMDYDLLVTLSELYSFTDIPRKRVRDIIEIFDKNILHGEAFRTIKQFISNAICDSPLCDSLASFSNLFAKYPSEHTQIQFLKKKGNFTEPETYKIGERKDFKEVDGIPVAISVSMDAQFIPLRHTLKSFFELDNVLQQTLFYMDQLTQNSSIISNFIQGEYWQGLEKGNSTVIPLVLYFDEYEVNNPLGSHAGVNKVGAVYCSIPCIPVEFQSKLENIFMVLLFNVLDRKLTDDRFIFTKLVEELNFLKSTGIIINLKNSTHKIHFRLALIIGDNLGIHSILGFTESFAANYPCRFCLTERSDFGIIFYEEQCILRTKENYDECLKQNNLSQTGVKSACVFNSVVDFHIILALCVDPMHDILEGVCKYDLGFILHYYIYVKKYFSFDTLNNRLNAYPYDPNEKKSKPPSITDSHLSKKKIHLSSSEMLCLVRNITLVIGDLVPIDDEFWQVIIMLHSIVDIVFASHIQKEVCNYLQTIIAEYLSTISTLGLQLRPKHHFLTHYPRIMKLMGPLGQLSCMRFESKHQKSKIIAHATTSRVNICKTLAFKNQLIFSLRLLKNKGYYSTFEVGPLSGLYFWHEFEEHNLLKVTSTKYITFLGRKIKVGKSVLVRPNGIDKELLLVDQILVQEFENPGITLICKLLNYCYNQHYDAFEVLNEDPKKCTLNYYNLFECDLSSYKIYLNGRMFVRK